MIYILVMVEGLYLEIGSSKNDCISCYMSCQYANLIYIRCTYNILLLVFL